MEKHEKGELSPKQKAKELLQSMMMSTNSVINFTTGDMDYLPQNQYAKQCAMIAVDEIINNSAMNYIGAYVSDNEILSDIEYWQQVKTEIEKL
jgi:hypothetical protein